MLDRVTFTGADDTTDAEALVTLLEEFPIAEAGILLGSREGTTRFPSKRWLDNLFERCHYRTTRLSLHLCGKWARSFLTEKEAFDPMLLHFSGKFERVQLNTHGEPHVVGMSALLHNLKSCADRGVEVVFQRDGVNDEIFNWARQMNLRSYAETLKLSTLFDLSHGAGKKPEHWPAPVQGVYCGYAGGIGPDDVGECLRQIAQVVELAEAQRCSVFGSTRYWVDAETGLMSPATGHLNLGLVRLYLSAASLSAAGERG